MRYRGYLEDKARDADFYTSGRTLIKRELKANLKLNIFFIQNTKLIILTVL